jgi:hypothetical protein
MMKRTDKSDSKLTINGSFDDVIKVSVTGNPAPAPRPVKPKKKNNVYIKNNRCIAVALGDCYVLFWSFNVHL